MSESYYFKRVKRDPNYRKKCNERLKKYAKTPIGKITWKRQRIRVQQEIKALKDFAASKGWRYSKVQCKMLRIE